MLDIHDGSIYLERMIRTIRENRDYLSEIDGKTGDGDHGVNMNKGFALCSERLQGKEYNLSEGLRVLSETLMEDIGGSMGPLYGVMFESMSMVCAEKSICDTACFETMLSEAIESIQEIGGAVKGDKTLLDTLIPAYEAFVEGRESGSTYIECLSLMKTAAKRGFEDTQNMVAKMGRASRLGERSRGVFDAGAASCYLLLSAIADAAIEELTVVG